MVLNTRLKRYILFLLEGYDPSFVQRIRHTILRSAYLQSTCPHPNIVRFIGMYRIIPSMPNKGVPISLMELMDSTLSLFVERDGPIPLRSALSILYDVSLGLWYLHTHSPPVMHCYLIPNNVLVNTSPLVAKIAGLGEVTLKDFNNEKIPGMVYFMAPEVLAEKYPLYSMSCDIFSYGGVALYTVVGEWPVPSDQVEVDPKTRTRVALSEVKRRRQYLDKMIGEAAVLRPLVEECLDDDPARRPTIDEVSERIKQINIIYMDHHPETKVTSVYTCMLYVTWVLGGHSQASI